MIFLICFVFLDQMSRIHSESQISPRIQRRDDSGCYNQEDCGDWMICDWGTGGGSCAGCQSGVNCEDFQNLATKYQCYNECLQMEQCKSSLLRLHFNAVMMVL